MAGNSNSGRQAGTAKVEAMLVVVKIRKLLKQGYTVSEAARRVGWSKERTWYAAKNITYNGFKLLVSDLGITRGTGKLCRRCGESRLYYTKSLICLECSITELVKKGLILLEDRKDDAQEITQSASR